MKKMKFNYFEKSTLSEKQLFNTRGGNGTNTPLEIDENGNILPGTIGPGGGDDNGDGKDPIIIP